MSLATAWRTKLTIALSLPLTLCFALQAAEDPATDCPAAFRAYSSKGTPLLDLLLNPATKALVDRDIPGFLTGLPDILKTPAPPTLADILTIRDLANEFIPIPEASLDKLDQDLALVQPTREAAIARCARYDHTPPALPEPLNHPAILVFSKSNGFRDDPSVNGAKSALESMAARAHWSLFFTDNAAVFNAADLKRFDAIVWNNVSGDVLTVAQRAAFKSYIEGAEVSRVFTARAETFTTIGIGTRTLSSGRDF